MSSVENDLERETAEASAEHPVADGSVGSDTETTKTLTSEDAGKDVYEAPHHARSNSVKKPTSFKAVSVTKNFLAKAGTVTTPNAKINGDKSEATLNTAIESADTSRYVCHSYHYCPSHTSASTSRKVSQRTSRPDS